jgi:hypothetical protein
MIVSDRELACYTSRARELSSSGEQRILGFGFDVCLRRPSGWASNSF